MTVKDVLLFVLKGCPHCKQALRYQQELLDEHPAWREIPLSIVDEREDRALAASHDYYLVPAYYVDGEKLHEGHAEQEDVARVLRLAME